MELDRSVSWFQNRSVELQPISKCKIYIIRKSIWKGAPHTGHTTQNGLQKFKMYKLYRMDGANGKNRGRTRFLLVTWKTPAKHSRSWATTTTTTNKLNKWEKKIAPTASTNAKRRRIINRTETDGSRGDTKWYWWMAVVAVFAKRMYFMWSLVWGGRSFAGVE